MIDCVSCLLLYFKVELIRGQPVLMNSLRLIVNITNMILNYYVHINWNLISTIVMTILTSAPEVPTSIHMSVSLMQMSICLWALGEWDMLTVCGLPRGLESQWIVSYRPLWKAKKANASKSMVSGWVFNNEPVNLQ